MRMLLTLTLLTALTAVIPTHAADIDSDDLKPGLIAIHRDGPQSLHRLEPTIALHLTAKDAVHPRLGIEAGMSRWNGYLNITRRGSYIFSVNLRGTLSVKIDGKVILKGENLEPETKSIMAAPVELDGGVHTIEAEFVRPTGLAMLELFWDGPGFQREPLAVDALGHLPAEQTPAFTRDAWADHGRLQLEEHSCIRCHSPGADKSFVERTGPNLTKIGERTQAGWLYQWLGDPKSIRPDTQMPKMFTDDATGQAERYALTQYLATLGGPIKLPPPNRNLAEFVKSSLRGQTLFTTSGCGACHQTTPPKTEPNREIEAFIQTRNYRLNAVGSKMTTNHIATYLKNPLATNPHGRMPSLNLNDQEAQDLSNFLAKDVDPRQSADMPSAPANDIRDSLLPNNADAKKLYDATPEKNRWAFIGQTLMTSKGCVNCHAVDSQKLPLRNDYPTLASLKGKAPVCGPKGPDYAFAEPTGKALRAFLEVGLGDAPGSPAAAYQTRQSLTRFNCLNCHQRDGEGGLDTTLQQAMSKMEKAENADAVLPPTLNGIGHKLRTPWIKQVLTQSGRARPWMGLRMPQYGEPNVGTLAEGLSYIEGAPLSDEIYQPSLTASKIEAGRLLIGKNGFGCIGCHDIAGIENSGTRGPDLSTTNQRVRYEWFRRWMEQPLRMAPGTRMPQVFVNGKSQIDRVFDGSGDQQSDAMWAYLSLGKNLPLPAGLEPPKGLTLIVGDRPEILRTFMPDAGNRAIAIGYPNGLSLAFDAQRCRTAYAWAGNFLDASPVWNNRGGAPAKILGNRYWSGPTGNPWAVSGSREPPDFLTRSKDPAYGADLPDGQIYLGPMALNYQGYTLDPKGYPTFRYRITGGSDASLQVSETPEPVRAAVASGILRRFAIESTTRDVPWLFAGESGNEPRVVDTSGKLVEIDWKAASPEAVTAGHWVLLPQPGGSLTVLQAPKAPEGTTWRFQPRNGGGWNVVLKLPDATGKAEIELLSWSLPKDDLALLKGLTPLK